jgi:hypothetical protein
MSLEFAVGCWLVADVNMSYKLGKNILMSSHTENSQSAGLSIKIRAKTFNFSHHSDGRRVVHWDEQKLTNLKP